MTNGEKYKEQVLDITLEGDTLVAVCKGKPYSCKNVSCENCQFYETGESCPTDFIKWLYKEYEEKPTLSEKAYHLLKSLPDDAEIIIANGFLYVITDGVMDSMDYFDFLPEFPEELENGKRHKVSDLLKLEVEK